MAAAPSSVKQSDLQPGESSAKPPPDQNNEYEQSAYAVSEGKRLFQQYNCSGCHANGGGGMGPALMDDKWIYGSSPQNIFNTIMEGRPNGMPSFEGKIETYQGWQITAYVRSLGGQLRKDVSPSRDDDMSSRPSEQQLPQQIPKREQAVHTQ
jgi:cytochrome c oxidase cbb3-type subunit III